jgi:hypothetical protein
MENKYENVWFSAQFVLAGVVFTTFIVSLAVENGEQGSVSQVFLANDHHTVI